MDKLGWSAEFSALIKQPIPPLSDTYPHKTPTSRKPVLQPPKRPLSPSSLTPETKRLCTKDRPLLLKVKEVSLCNRPLFLLPWSDSQGTQPVLFCSRAEGSVAKGMGIVL